MATDNSLGDAVDMATFSQILEMDDTDDREFSSSIVFGFFDQVQETFSSMDKALLVLLTNQRNKGKQTLMVQHRADRNLEELSSLGHFLKGSSATLGLIRVRDGCEKIQRFGKLENEDGSSEPNTELQLQRITLALSTIKTDYKDVEATLRRFYENTEQA